jgi:uncharacterized membrane protein YhhN
MITLSLLVCLVGLVIWVIASKVSAASDALAAEAGRLMFVAGLLAYLLNVGMKTL